MERRGAISIGVSPGLRHPAWSSQPFQCPPSQWLLLQSEWQQQGLPGETGGIHPDLLSNVSLQLTAG